MKLVFAHDHRFLSDGKYYYSKSGLPQAVLERYVNVFGELLVICRCDTLKNSCLEPINHPDIQFYPQKNIRSIKGIRYWGVVNDNVRDLVASADGVIARLPSTLGLMAAKQARIMGKPYLIEVVGNGLEAGLMHGNPLGKIISPLAHRVTCREIDRADRVVYITKSYLQKVYPTQGNAYTCSNVKVTPITDRQLQERLVRFAQKKRVSIGLIGSLDVNYKGHDVALKVLKKIRESGFENVDMEFVGGGDRTRWLKLSRELGVTDRVKFKGMLPPGPEVMAWLDRMDIMLQPSKTEGQGRSIIEAMSRGCPVVSSERGGIPELLDSNMICEPSDVEGLALRCISLIKSKELYSSIAFSNLNRSREFTEEVVEGRRREIFEAFRDSFVIGDRDG